MSELVVLSLGWGVQSFTLAAMSALGDLPPIDFALHADTTHERQATYEFAKKYTPWLESHEIRVITAKNTATELGTDKNRVVDIPAFTRNEKGSLGQISRQCTGDWKIAPMRRVLSQALKDRKLKKSKGVIQQWIGISQDEWQRMKDSDVKYIVHRWPLIDLKMTRADCVKYLQNHGLDIPPKSACTFCPFHDTEEWRSVRENPQDWEEAVRIDRQIRLARPPHLLYVHPSRKALEIVDFRTQEEHGQFRLWDNECSGICGV